MLLYRLRHTLRYSLWLVPLLCVLVGVGLSFGTAAIDQYFDYSLIPQIFTGNANVVQTLLNMIATSMVTFINLALTLTLVVIQLAMGQFSPRIVRALLGDRRTQLAIGLFAVTLAHSMLALREVDPQSNVVPGLTSVVAYVLMLASIGGLILYAHHVGQKLRVSGIVDMVGDELREQLNDLYPADHTGAASSYRDERVVVGREPGVVIRVDYEGLVAAAKGAGCVLEMVPAMGDFVPVGAPAGEVGVYAVAHGLKLVIEP